MNVSRTDLSREGRENQLYALYTEARQLVEDLSRSLHAITPTNQGQISQQPQQQLSEQAIQMSEPLMLATGSLLSSALYEVSSLPVAKLAFRFALFYTSINNYFAPVTNVSFMSST